MPHENVEIVRRALELNRSGDLAAAVEGLIDLSDPRVEFRSALAGLEGGAYRGHEGVRQYLADMSESWRDWRNEAAEIEEIGPDTVLASFVFRATGKDSGVPVERRNAVVWTVSEGRITRAITFESRAAALEATRPPA